VKSEIVVKKTTDRHPPFFAQPDPSLADQFTSSKRPTVSSIAALGESQMTCEIVDEAMRQLSSLLVDGVESFNLQSVDILLYSFDINSKWFL